ncbi:acetyl-CoA C-acyltransferase family protein [Methylobacterium longum]|uniref:Acetyl-CoA C-acyltransferase family protein n=1 Tax=Methylobacterium longum TaxID=767694 RepID=A0ABT8AH31_9HYPH|nr:acetyl-CoA C-acyltransferase family protein [Methylobacterium longum]MDN3569059.1 acetyl-CoA C-acyltransferase family protein [Methylobacterium longum]GJE10468.1 Beta-ketothiolase BktB [Methylobacterium longum]
MTDVVITGAVRTAIGTFGGSLASIPPAALAAQCVAEALRRAATAPEAIGHVVFGSVIPTEPRDAYLARVAAMEGGIPKEVPAMTVNRLCGSGLQAIVSAAQSILLGDAETAVAGGAESMSRAPHLLKVGRTGQRMGDAVLVDYMLGALNDPFGNGHMGVTAENVAERYAVSRDQQDAFAAESQARAARAIREGRFRDQILPVAVQRKRETVAFDTDEHPKAASAEELAKLRPAFSKTGSVTAGNASGLNDGAAALVLSSADRAERDGRTPLARIVGYAHAGVDPSEMGMGPVPAVRRLLERTGLRAADFDVIESNEAFASQACAVSRELDLDPAKVNPNGGAIALGHPIGATGAIITVKALYELARTGGRYGLVTMCIGGGQGIAMAVERLR